MALVKVSCRQTKEGRRHPWIIQVRNEGASKSATHTAANQTEMHQALITIIDAALDAGQTVDVTARDEIGAGERVIFKPDGSMVRRPFTKKVAPRCAYIPLSSAAKKRRRNNYTALRKSAAKKTRKPKKRKVTTPSVANKVRRTTRGISNLKVGALRKRSNAALATACLRLLPAEGKPEGVGEATLADLPKFTLVRAITSRSWAPVRKKLKLNKRKPARRVGDAAKPNRRRVRKPANKTNKTTANKKVRKPRKRKVASAPKAVTPKATTPKKKPQGRIKMRQRKVKVRRHTTKRRVARTSQNKPRRPAARLPSVRPPSPRISPRAVTPRAVTPRTASPKGLGAISDDDLLDLL